MSTNLKLAEWGWKIFTLCMGALILPLAGWVWNTNVALAIKRFIDAEEVIVVLEKKEEAEQT